MFASADYSALCDMKTVWLNYNFIWNTMAEFHRILRRFLPLSLSSIVLYDIIMFVHDPFFSHIPMWYGSIHSLGRMFTCSHNIIYQFEMERQWQWVWTFFRTFHYYTNQQSYTIHNNYVYWFLYGIHSLQNVLVSCKMIYIYHCHMFGTRADVVAAFTHIANNRPTAYVWKSTWTKNTKLFVIYPLWFIPLHDPETRNPKCIHWHTEKMWAKRRDFEVYLNQWRKKQLGKHQNTKKIHINEKLTNFKDSFESIGIGTLSISCIWM